MTLPKGYGPGGKRAEGAGPRDEIERMIGRRVEHMNGIYVLGFILCLVGTWGGIYVGVTVYPWAYPLPSGLFAGSVLTVIITLGLIFIVKIANEKPVRP
jgi:fatty acid desaturase